MPGWVREVSALKEDGQIGIKLRRADFLRCAEGEGLEGELELEERDADVLECFTERHGLLFLLPLL